MSRVRVDAGACGFVTRISASKEDGKRVRLEIQSDCEAVTELGRVLEKRGGLTLWEVVAKGFPDNRVLDLGHQTLSHPGCPVVVAVIKAAEVELGLNVPSRVTVEFEADAGCTSDAVDGSSVQDAKRKGTDDQRVPTRP